MYLRYTRRASRSCLRIRGLAKAPIDVFLACQFPDLPTWLFARVRITALGRSRSNENEGVVDDSLVLGKVVKPQNTAVSLIMRPAPSFMTAFPENLRASGYWFGNDASCDRGRHPHHVLLVT
jgi:hypothetical protein